MNDQPKMSPFESISPIEVETHPFYLNGTSRPYARSCWLPQVRVTSFFKLVVIVLYPAIDYRMIGMQNAFEHHLFEIR